MKLYKCASCAAVVCILFAGCGKSKAQMESYQKIVDDYAVLILKEDEDSKAYDDALSAVGTYLEQRDENVLNDAKTKVRETKESMEEASERIASYEMEDPFEELLTEYQIAPEEYLMFAVERKE